jgi:hypothetical protein
MGNVCLIVCAWLYPWIIWPRTSSRPSWSCVTSTFLRQAFLPLRDGCLYVAGAVFVVAMIALYCVLFNFEMLTVSETFKIELSKFQSRACTHRPSPTLGAWLRPLTATLDPLVCRTMASELLSLSY